MKAQPKPTKFTVRETQSDSKLAIKVAKLLSKVEGVDVSKNKAYIRAMQTLAFQLGI